MVESVKPDIASNVVNVVVHGPGFCAKVWVVGNGGDIYTTSGGGGLEKLHVSDGSFVRCACGHVCPLLSIFILNLIEENVAAASELVVSNYGGNVVEIRCPGLSVSGIIVTKGTISTSSEPTGKATGGSLGVDIRARAEQDVETEGLANGKERGDVVRASFKVQSTIGCGMVSWRRLVLEGMKE